MVQLGYNDGDQTAANAHCFDALCCPMTIHWNDGSASADEGDKQLRSAERVTSLWVATGSVTKRRR